MIGSGPDKNTQHKLNSNHFALHSSLPDLRRKEHQKSQIPCTGGKEFMDSFPPLMRSSGAILGIIEQSTRSQNAAHFNKNGTVWSHFVSQSLVHTILMVEASMGGSFQTEKFKRKGKESQISPPEKNATLVFH